MMNPTRLSSICLATLAFSGLDASALAQTCLAPQWRQLSPKTSPPGRQFAAMTYDSARERIVMFGGMTALAANLGDTWEWDGDDWSLRSSSGPTPRNSARMTFDSDRGVVVLFGGIDNSGRRADTWEWDGSTWTLASTQGPDPQGLVGLAFDSARAVTILFDEHGDTWEWNGAFWVTRSTTGPSDRFNFGMAYDSARSRTVLFGGTGGADTQLSDTWLYDGTSWTFQASLHTPPARYAPGFAFDSAREKMIMFGGSQGREPLQSSYDDTWEFDGANWLNLIIAGPSARGDACMAFDAAGQQMVLFGGRGTQWGLADTWSLVLTPVADPVITDQPDDFAGVPKGDAVFEVQASIEGPAFYRWRRNGFPLSDDDHYSGAFTSTLTIHNLTTFDIVDYDVVVSNYCSSVTSDTVTLTLTLCRADFNRDLLVTSQDFFDFVNAFFNLSPLADFNADAILNSSDFFDFLAEYFTPCP